MMTATQMDSGRAVGYRQSAFGQTINGTLAAKAPLACEDEYVTQRNATCLLG